MLEMHRGKHYSYEEYPISMIKCCGYYFHYAFTWLLFEGGDNNINVLIKRC